MDFVHLLFSENVSPKTMTPKTMIMGTALQQNSLARRRSACEEGLSLEQAKRKQQEEAGSLIVADEGVLT